MLTFKGRYQSKLYDKGGAEIVAYHAGTRRLFVVNAQLGTLDVLDITNPAAPTKVVSDGGFSAAFDLAVDIPTVLGGFVARAANSVAVSGDLLAVAVEAAVPGDPGSPSRPSTDPGAVALYSAVTGAFITAWQVGSLPDMVTFSPDGKLILVANEGEAAYDYSVDPEGSVGIIDGSDGGFTASAPVTLAGFTGFNGLRGRLLAGGAHLTNLTFPVDGGSTSVAQDIEPEYITVSTDSRTAYVTCQEANLIAVVDLVNKRVAQVLPLGFKDHSFLGNGLDPSDRDVIRDGGNAGRIDIASWPVFGMYQPDGIASFTARGVTYLVTANEGDARSRTDWGQPFNEEVRAGSLTLQPPLRSEVLDQVALGRLNVTNQRGDFDMDGGFEALYTFGARSFSIWTTTGSQVFDSADELEQITAAVYPANFNAGHTTNSLDDRSDNKGPEPEGVVVGTVGNRIYAFIGLERIGGVMVYEVTEPRHARFVQYLNTRNFGESGIQASVEGDGGVGDLGPEGLLFIPAAQAPEGVALLVVGNEISGTTAIYEFR